MLSCVLEDSERGAMGVGGVLPALSGRLRTGSFGASVL